MLAPITSGRVLAAGFCTMVVAMGFGRFSYTPILPVMQAELGFDVFGYEDAGLLASFNFAGYLAGALGAGYLPEGRDRTRILRLLLAAGVAALGLMAATELFALWAALRLLSGVAGGVLFVFSADMVMRALARDGRAHLAGVHFAGVGIGIALSGVAAPLFAALGGWRGDWAGLALVSVLLVVPAWLWLRDDPGGAGAPDGGGASAPGSFPLGLLAFAYFLQGLGYVVTSTFLVSILQSGPGGLVGPAAWVVVGLAAVPASVVWTLVAARWSHVGALVLAQLVQGVGIALPALSDAAAAGIVSALLFGGTFMGVTALMVAFGRMIAPASTARAIALLTASFGLGQIVGPVVAGTIAERTGSFDAALLMASLAVLVGAFVLLLPRRR